MVDNVASDEVEPKPTKNEASGDGSGDVKPTTNMKAFKVKTPFQARIGKIEEPKPVPIGVVRHSLIFYNKCKMDRETRVTWLGSSTRGKGGIWCLYR